MREINFSKATRFAFVYHFFKFWHGFLGRNRLERNVADYFFSWCSFRLRWWLLGRRSINIRNWCGQRRRDWRWCGWRWCGRRWLGWLWGTFRCLIGLWWVWFGRWRASSSRTSTGTSTGRRCSSSWTFFLASVHAKDVIHRVKEIKRQGSLFDIKWVSWEALFTLQHFVDGTTVFSLPSLLLFVVITIIAIIAITVLSVILIVVIFITRRSFLRFAIALFLIIMLILFSFKYERKIWRKS